MALSDPQQLESRFKNIESTVEQRFTSNEKKIDEFVEKLCNMLKMIENNDTSVKAEVKDKFDTQERSMAKMSTDLINGATGNQVVTSASVKTFEDNARHEFDGIKSTLNNQTGRLGQTEVEGQSVANRIAMIEIVYARCKPTRSMR